ncbi:MAG TPA: hypothetical protein VMM93_10405 [Vicinamibacterales bacterium]|nr:hypothetical protein [Vicinamibacterales bacterium]
MRIRATGAGFVRLAAVATIALLAFSSSPTSSLVASRPAPVATAQPGALSGVLTRYAAGQHEAALSGLLAVPDIKPYVRLFQEGTPVWIAGATDPDEVAYRRLLVATVILEIAHARLQEDWADVRGLVEWACALLRVDPPRPEERLWQRASLAVVEGAYDWRFLTTAPPARRGETPDPNLFGHAAHVRERFPDEARFAMAEGMIVEAAAPREPAAEQALPVSELARFGLAGPAVAARARARAAVAIDAYAALVDDSDVGAEASLRQGYLLYRLGDAAAALDAYARSADRAADDAWVRYLAHYFTGRLRERAGSLAEAEAAYRRALEAMPGAQSSAIALSALLFRHGRPDAAYGVMESASAVEPTPVDPWRTYGYGDLRFWPDLVLGLRAQVRR